MTIAILIFTTPLFVGFCAFILALGMSDSFCEKCGIELRRQGR